MAGITRHPNGCKEVTFFGLDKKRKKIRLGRVDDQTAEFIRKRIEELLLLQISGRPVSVHTKNWLAKISDKLHEKLVRNKICDPKHSDPPKDVSLNKILGDYIARRDDLKDGTVQIYKQSKKHLVRFFGAERDMNGITIGEAGDFRRDIRKLYSEAYTAKMIIKARTYWRDAMERGLVTQNVFLKVKTGSQVNKANQRFVDRKTIDSVIAVCPTPQWKLLLALSRYAGLRCPSEHLALQWTDVDWDRGRMTIHASKTEHYEDKGIRVIPIFPEVAPYLRAVFEQRDAKSTFVITQYRRSNANLRSQLLRYIKKAGHTPWPRLFHNLRASCQTELAERFPAHVICQWIGNSEAVARAHYLQTTEDHFALAVEAKGSEAEANTKIATSQIGTENHRQDIPPELYEAIRAILKIAKQFGLH